MRENMPHRFGFGWGAAALALALLVQPAGTRAQSQYPTYDQTQPPTNSYLGPGPYQGTQQVQQQQLQTAPSGPTRDVMGIINPPSTTGVTRPGEATQAEGGPTVQAPISETERPAVGAVQPFGASLFAGTSPASSDAPNPAYRVQTGDKVEIRVWGGYDADTTSPVDPEGNVFLQGVGPIHVAGVAASDLQRTIEHSVSNVFTQKVYVYAVLVTTHRVAVFVTGYVKRPGRYTGSASDSVLDYLVRAGGVDAARGSYRDITVHRQDQILAVVDLYRFLIAGTMPMVDLREGDTIIVGRQHAMVSVDGAVRNSFLFEMLDTPVPGRSVIELSRPLPSATNAIVRGTRNDVPFVRYVTINNLASLTLADQDQVTFITDAPPDTVRVKVEGSRLGPSVLVADRTIQLPDVLNYIAVDPALADTKSVFILRQSIAAQQQRALTEAADRLERELFLAISTTTGEAQIRASEANLVASYIQRARRVRPEGRLVVSDDDGAVAPLRLEDGDTIVIPEKSQLILVSGEVLAPQAVVFRPELKAEDYVLRAGGYSQRGATGNFLIRRANGQIYLDPKVPLRPGDELIVLPEVSAKYFQIAADFITVMYQVALAGKVICTTC
jgi:protein involved in polysaccharide export with SLBB domain